MWSVKTELTSNCDLGVDYFSCHQGQGPSDPTIQMLVMAKLGWRRQPGGGHCRITRVVPFVPTIDAMYTSSAKIRECWPDGGMERMSMSRLEWGFKWHESMLPKWEASVNNRRADPKKRNPINMDKHTQTGWNNGNGAIWWKAQVGLTDLPLHWYTMIVQTRFTSTNYTNRHKGLWNLRIDWLRVVFSRLAHVRVPIYGCSLQRFTIGGDS